MKNSAKIYPVVFIKKLQINSSVYAFYFSLPKDFVYTAGQYIQMTLLHDDVDERGSSRFFTISSSPTEKEYLMITSRKGWSSFKKALFSLKKGDTVQIFGPMGTFVLPED